MRIKMLAVVVSIFLFHLNCLAQNQEIEITCKFVKKGYPIQKKLFGKMQLEVSYTISNTSDENLMIPVPSPLFTLFKPSGDTLSCVLNDPKFIPAPARFEEITFVNIPNQRTIRYVTDVLEGCDFGFEDGEKYKIIAEFWSVYKGKIEVDGESTNIWKGSVKSEPISFRFKD